MKTSYIGKVKEMLTSLIGKRGKLGNVRFLDTCGDLYTIYKAEAEVDEYKVVFIVIVNTKSPGRNKVLMFTDSSRTHLITQWVPWSRRSRMTNKANLTKHMLKALL